METCQVTLVLYLWFQFDTVCKCLASQKHKLSYLLLSSLIWPPCVSGLHSFFSHQKLSAKK